MNRIEWLIAHRPEYAKKFGAPAPSIVIPLYTKIRPPCAEIGNLLEICHTCVDDSRSVYECDIYKKCTRGFVSGKVQSCLTCPSYRVERPPMQWAYGVTTVPERKGTTLPKTLESLRESGFDKPRLFVDGSTTPREWEVAFDLETTVRYPALRIHGNWILSLYELYLRNPSADRYAIFQDDIVCVKNLKAYLEATTLPESEYGNHEMKRVKQERVYWNLYTFLSNEELAKREGLGWVRSNQLGKGALATVFTVDAVKLLLGHQHMVDRVQNRKIADRNPLGWELGQEKIDGGIVDTMKKCGYTELVHNPSLVEHTGIESVSGHMRYPASTMFPGEGYDPLKG